MITAMNIKRQTECIQKELDEAVLSVLHSANYILGEEEKKFEEAFAEYCGVKHAVGVANGTDALVIALRACGVKPGDEVITSAMSFFATAEAVASIGAIPVFVDCTKDTYLIDAAQIESKITEKTAAILPVHLYGQCADMDRILKIAHKYGLKVIEDTAQAAGALYKGKKAGSMGDVGCVSFFPTKNLGCAGDGGMILTNDANIYQFCMALRVHGSGMYGAYMYQCEQEKEERIEHLDFHGHLPKYYNFVLGYNSRLDTIQAAVLNVKLPYLDGWNEKRRQIAERYDAEIKNPLVQKPIVEMYNEHIYYVYMLVVKNRDKMRDYLETHGVGTGVYFPVPLHLQKVFAYLGYQKGDFPNAEMVADHSLVIPMFAEMTDDEISHVIETVNAYQE